MADGLRVQFVHDWLTGMRGGEKVLLELVRMYPESRIATLVHVPGATDRELDERVNAVSFLQGMPGVKGAKGGGAYRNYLPLFPRAVRGLKLDETADLYVSVSHAVAKGIRVPVGADGKRKAHICYCNTPMRYIWGMEDQYLSKWSAKRAALAAVKPYLRRFDRRNEGVTRFIGNSRNVAGRIERLYGREAEVVYPGIDETFYTPPTARAPREGYLVVSALVGYKRVDLAVEAVRAMAGRKLTVIGSGPEEAKLRSLARGAEERIRFLGRAPDEAVREEYRKAAAFLFPGEEDFGLTPVEAQACGTPVIAYRAGGALETVREGETGVFFAEQSVAGLRGAMEEFEKRAAGGKNFSEAACRENALGFTWERFRRGIRKIVEETVGGGAWAGDAGRSKMAGGSPA